MKPLRRLTNISCARFEKRVCTNPSAFSRARKVHTSICAQRRGCLNLCANNYLGLADHPEVVQAAREALERWGYGLASVRFICGTQEIHKELEGRLSEFLGMEDTILYSSCFDANGGLFETMLDEGDAIISDELNHASIIDGIRLSKAQRFRYRNGDMEDLAAKLQEAAHAAAYFGGHRWRVLDGWLYREASARYAIWPNVTAPW